MIITVLSKTEFVRETLSVSNCMGLSADIFSNDFYVFQLVAVDEYFQFYEKYQLSGKRDEIFNTGFNIILFCLQSKTFI